MGSAAGATPDLLGTWSGDRHVLTISETGARLETDCALSEFGEPWLGREGQFKAKGMHHAGTGGPQAGDAVPSGPAATLEGMLKEGRLELVLAVAGSPPQPLSLQRGQRVKLIRCL